MSGVTSIYPMILENVDDTLYADVEATLPADYVAATTKYLYQTSNNDVFLSFNVNGSNIYRLNKTTKEFDIIGAIANKYLNTWKETEDGLIVASGGTTGIYYYDTATNSMLLHNKLCEYFEGDGEVVTFNFKLTTGTYANPLVYVDNELMPVEAEYSDIQDGGTILYLLSKTPSIASPITTDFVVKLNGSIIPNEAQTNYSYIWQPSPTNKGSIVFPPASSYIPQDGDTVEIIYDVISYTTGNYYVTFNTAPADGAVIVVTYNAMPLLTYTFKTTAAGDLFASYSGNILLRYDNDYLAWEVLYYIASGGTVTYRIENSLGDTAWSSTSASSLKVLPKNSHSFITSDTFAYGYFWIGSDNDIWFTPNSSNEQYGITRYDAVAKTITSYLVGSLSSNNWGDVFTKFAVNTITKDVYIVGGQGVLVYDDSEDTASIETPTGTATHSFWHVQYLPLHDYVIVLNASYLYFKSGNGDWVNSGSIGTTNTSYIVENDTYIFAHTGSGEGHVHYYDGVSWTYATYYGYFFYQDNAKNLYFSSTYYAGINSKTCLVLNNTFKRIFAGSRSACSSAIEYDDYVYTYCPQIGTSKSNGTKIVKVKKSDGEITDLMGEYGAGWKILKHDSENIVVASVSSLSGVYNISVATDEIAVLHNFGTGTLLTSTISYTIIDATSILIMSPTKKRVINYVPAFAIATNNAGGVVATGDKILVFEEA